MLPKRRKKCESYFFARSVTEAVLVTTDDCITHDTVLISGDRSRWCLSVARDEIIQNNTVSPSSVRHFNKWIHLSRIVTEPKSKEKNADNPAEVCPLLFFVWKGGKHAKRMTKISCIQLCSLCVVFSTIEFADGIECWWVLSDRLFVALYVCFTSYHCTLEQMFTGFTKYVYTWYLSLPSWEREIPLESLALGNILVWNRF